MTGDAPSEHTRAMIAAGAHANGVPANAQDEDEGSDILAFLEAYKKLQVALQNFPS